MTKSEKIKLINKEQYERYEKLREKYEWLEDSTLPDYFDKLRDYLSKLVVNTESKNKENAIEIIIKRAKSSSPIHIPGRGFSTAQSLIYVFWREFYTLEVNDNPSKYYPPFNVCETINSMDFSDVTTELNYLTDKQKTIIKKRHVDNMQYAEISKNMQISENEVIKILEKAYSKILTMHKKLDLLSI